MARFLRCSQYQPIPMHVLLFHLLHWNPVLAATHRGLHAPHCSAVAFSSGDDVIFSASIDPFAAKGRIYRRRVKPDGSRVAVEGGMPAWIEGIAGTGCIAASDSSIAVADRAGNLYGADDFGRAWSCGSTKLPTPSGVLIC
jgi:hypothetical protein